MSTRTFWRRLRERAAPRREAAPQADWTDAEAWQADRTHAVTRKVHQKASRFLPEVVRTFFSQWRHALRSTLEARRLELRRGLEGVASLNLQIAWCQCGMDAQVKAASNATWKAKQHWLEGQADSMAHMQETGDWAATWPQEARVPPSSAHARRWWQASRVSPGQDQSAPARAHEGIRERTASNLARRNISSHQGTGGQASGPCRAHQAAAGHKFTAEHGARVGG